MSDAVPDSQEQPIQDVLSRQQRRQIERARQKAERSVEELPFPMRVRLAERDIKNLRAGLNDIAQLLLAAGVIEIVPGTNSVRVRRARPLWKRLLRRS